MRERGGCRGAGGGTQGPGGEPRGTAGAAGSKAWGGGQSPGERRVYRGHRGCRQLQEAGQGRGHRREGTLPAEACGPGKAKLKAMTGSRKGRCGIRKVLKAGQTPCWHFPELRQVLSEARLPGLLHRAPHTLPSRPPPAPVTTTPTRTGLAGRTGGIPGSLRWLRTWKFRQHLVNFLPSHTEARGTD